LSVLILKHAPSLVAQTQERRPDHVSSLGLFQQFEWRRLILWSVLLGSGAQAGGFALKVTHAMACNAQEPSPELAAGMVELVELLDGQQPDLLTDILGGASVAAQQVIGQPEDRTDVSIVHDRPRRPVAAGHLPQQAEFVIHRSTAPVEWILLPIYCRQLAESFAILPGKLHDVTASVVTVEPRLKLGAAACRRSQSEAIAGSRSSAAPKY
jgi:hypothetical protein